MMDEQVEQDGVKVLIDNKALLNIIGSEMDWLEDKLNERFIFKNPNISKSGSSQVREVMLTRGQPSNADAANHSVSVESVHVFLFLLYYRYLHYYGVAYPASVTLHTFGV
jgi:hypothetical protein